MVKLIDCPECNRKNVQHNAFGLCLKCYKKIHKIPKKECYACGKIGIINKLDNNKNPICIACYCRTYNPPHKKCDKCGKLDHISCKNINNQQLCKKCARPYYIQLKEKCSACGKLRNVHRRTQNYILCKICYSREEYNINEDFRIKSLIRTRIRSAFQQYVKDGKISISEKYSIDYKAIIEHLGPCPGKRDNYHIDHIFPLEAFDLTNLEQIKKAFAPENHQWLKKEENLSKSCKYDKEKFEKYLQGVLNEHIT